MKPHVIVILITFLSSAVNCDDPVLIGSYFMPSSSNYKVFLIASDEDSRINLTLKAQGFESSFIIGQQNSTDNSIEFMVDQLPDNYHPSYHLEVEYNNDLSCKQHVQLINMSKRPIILIQLDKLYYKAGDEIKFRVFVLSQKLVPFDSIDDMNIVIYDHLNNVIESIENASATDGVYNGVAKIHGSSENARWKIEVEVNGRKKSMTFIVDNKKENSLQVELVVDEQVSIKSKKIYFGINVKPLEDKTFSGTAKIILYKGQNKRRSFIRALNITSQYTQTKFDISDDLLIRLLNTDMDLHFLVEISDKRNKIVASVRKTVVLKPIDRIIKLSKKNYFVPNIEFPVNIEVRKINGELENSFETLNLTVEYVDEDNVEKKVLLTDLENGKTFINLQPPADTKKIKLNLKFRETYLEDTIESYEQQGKNHYIFASAVTQKSSYVTGDIVSLSAKVDEEIEKLFVLIFGSNGIVDNKVLQLDARTDEFTFDVVVEESMIPQANVVMYHVRDDGTIVHDYLLLNVEFPIENDLEITLPEAANANNQITINVKAKQNSLVFLTGTDNIQQQNNEISINSIKNEFIKPELNFESDIFMLKLSQSKSCDEQPAFKENLEDLPTNIEIIAYQYFPRTWLQTEIKAENIITSFDQKTPDMPGMWRLQGIAIHPTKGLSTAKFQPIITITKNTSVFITKHEPVEEEGVFSVGYRVKNLLENDRTIKIKISVDNGKIIDPIEMSVSLRIKGSNEKSSNVVIKAGKGGTLKLKIKVEDENYESEIEIVVEKKFRKHLMYEVASLSLVAKSDNNNIQSIILKSEPSKANDLLTKNYDNLLGEALEGLESLYDPQYDYLEFAANKLEASVIAYEYFKFIDAKQKYEVALKKLKQNIKSLQNFNEDNIKDLTMVAYTAKVLAYAKIFAKVNETVVERYFDNILNNTLKNISNINLQRGIGGQNNQDIIMKQKVLISILKGKNFLSESEKFKHTYLKKIDDLINNLIEYKEKFFDYEKIMMAYSLALNGNIDESKEFIKNISYNFLKTSNYDKHKSVFLRVASYAILTKIILKADPQREIKWLLSQRKYDGRFYSPHDSVLAFHALLEFTKYAKNNGLNLDLAQNYILNEGYPKPNIETNSESIKVEYTFSYGIEYKNISQVRENFQVEVNAVTDSKILTIDFTIMTNFNENESIAETNLVIVEVQLPTAYKYTDKSFTSNNTLKLEQQDHGNFLIVYLEKMTSKEKCSFTLKAVKEDEMKNRGIPYVKIYDYYQPYFYGIDYYNVQIGKKPEVEVKNSVKTSTEFVD